MSLGACEGERREMTVVFFCMAIQASVDKRIHLATFSLGLICGILHAVLDS